MLDSKTPIISVGIEDEEEIGVPTIQETSITSIKEGINKLGIITMGINKTGTSKAVTEEVTIIFRMEEEMSRVFNNGRATQTDKIRGQGPDQKKGGGNK